MSDYTPGPLHIQQDSQWPYIIRVCDQTGATIHSEQLICSSSRWNGIEDARNLAGIHGDERVEWQHLMDRQMADMRLRAAAPDLLEALILVTQRCGPNSTDGAVARAAIVKASPPPPAGADDGIA